LYERRMWRHPCRYPPCITSLPHCGSACQVFQSPNLWRSILPPDWLDAFLRLVYQSHTFLARTNLVSHLSIYPPNGLVRLDLISWSYNHSSTSMVRLTSSGEILSSIRFSIGLFGSRCLWTIRYGYTATSNHHYPTLLTTGMQASPPLRRRVSRSRTVINASPPIP